MNLSPLYECSSRINPRAEIKGAKGLTNVGLSDWGFGTRCESRTSSHEIVLVATVLVKAGEFSKREEITQSRFF